MPFTTTQKVGGLGAVLVIIGAFLPWATWGFFSVAGIRGDGVITLILGAIVGLSLLSPIHGKKTWVAYIILGLIIVLIGVADALNVASIAAAPFGVPVEIGTGLLLTIFGGLVICLTGIISGQNTSRG